MMSYIRHCAGGNALRRPLLSAQGTADINTPELAQPPALKPANPMQVISNKENIYLYSGNEKYCTSNETRIQGA